MRIQGQDRHAIGFMVLASVLIAATMLLAKALGTGALGDGLHPVHVTHGRYLFALMVIVPAALWMRVDVRTKHMPLHVARSVAGFSGGSMMFAAAAFIPLSDATAISFLNPIFAMLLAVLFLNERVGPVRWGAACLALAGALLLLRPGFGSFSPAALLALAAAACFGVEITLIKRLTGAERPLQVLLINNVIGVSLASLAVIWVWSAPSPGEWAGLSALGVLMAAAQACYIQALRRAEASLVTPISYTTLIFVALYDLVIFGVIPDRVSGLGALIIAAGAALLTWRETRQPQKG